MRTMGWVLVGAGIIQMFYAVSMNVTLPAEPGIANNDLMAQRDLIFHGGGFAFLAGMIALGVERLRAAIERLKAIPD